MTSKLSVWNSPTSRPAPVLRVPLEENNLLTYLSHLIGDNLQFILAQMAKSVDAIQGMESKMEDSFNVLSESDSALSQKFESMEISLNRSMLQMEVMIKSSFSALNSRLDYEFKGMKDQLAGMVASNAEAGPSETKTGSEAFGNTQPDNMGFKGKQSPAPEAAYQSKPSPTPETAHVPDNMTPGPSQSRSHKSPSECIVIDHTDEVQKALLKTLPKEWEEFSGQGEYDHITWCENIDIQRNMLMIPDLVLTARLMTTMTGVARDWYLSKLSLVGERPWSYWKAEITKKFSTSI